METGEELNLLARAPALIEIALKLDEKARAVWLQELSLSEPVMAVEIKRRLAALRLNNESVDLAQTQSQSIAPAMLAIEDDEETDLVAPANMGPYRLIRQIGEGGMSTVWLAERTYANFVRQVAIKRLPPFRKNDGSERRLLREASILSSLNHPNIAKFFDAGISDEGDPYIALELIDGESITDYCDRSRLDVKSRIALMTKVCDAVAFLHRHSIIHRDIKPSNVMVDKAGEVKLLDFGIAKLMDEALAIDDATRSSCNAFTPEYAAPEQIIGQTVTTATDVYSLGVLLYRLLTGTRPYGRTEPVVLIASAIVNTPPSKPSTLFGPAVRLPEADLAQITAARKSSAGQLYTSLRNDLDNILLKALEKDIARRYTTVDAFCADLNAHLQSRPVRAQPASTLYVLRKFAQRHRGGVVASTLALLGLIVAISFGAWQARLTQLEVVKTKRVLTFLQTLIAEANPNNTGTETITALDLLKRAPDVAKQLFPGDAVLQYQVLKPVEQILRDLEDADSLEPVEREMVSLLPSMNKLKQIAPEEESELLTEYALTLAYLGKQDIAEASVEKALTSLTVARQQDSVAYARALMYKSKMLAYRRKLSEAATLGLDSHNRLTTKVSADNPLLTKSAFDLLDTLLGADRWQEATALVEKYFTPTRIENIANAKERLQYRMQYAVFLSQLGNPRLADEQYNTLLIEAKRFFGENNAVYPRLLQLAARSATDSGSYEKAARLFQDTASILQRAKTVDTRALANVYSQMALLQLHQNQIAAATATLKQAQSLMMQGGFKNATYWQAVFQSALLEKNFMRANAALDQQEAALPASLPADALARSSIALDRANVLRLENKASEALQINVESIANVRRNMPPNHYRVSRLELRLAQTLAATGKTKEALGLATAASQRINTVLGDTHPLALQGAFILGKIEEQAGNSTGEARASKAESAYEQLLQKKLDQPVERLH